MVDIRLELMDIRENNALCLVESFSMTCKIIMFMIFAHLHNQSVIIDCQPNKYLIFFVGRNYVALLIHYQNPSLDVNQY